MPSSKTAFMPDIVCVADVTNLHMQIFYAIQESYIL